MAFRFFDWLRGKREFREITSEELAAAGREFQIREIAFWACANMVANAFGRCEFKTYRNGQEIKEKEYYTWNVEANRNQNSTAFLHSVIAKLYKENEALIVDEPYGSGVVLAKHFELDDDRPTNVYRKVDLGIKDHRLDRMRERDVIHLVLNSRNMEEVVGALNDSYLRLVSAAMNNYLFSNGQHWKVEISSIASGAKDFEESFTQILQKQVKPFLNSETGLLPQFEGYKYSQISGGEKKQDSTEVRNLVEDVFNFTARGFGIPVVLINGKVEGTADANTRFLTNCIDPIADQFAEEINRKRYGYEAWRNGNYVQVDTSSIIHFDMFANAANVEKLIGSGAWSVNEVRKAAGDAPLKEAWADEHFLTLNISTMKEATSSNNSRRKEAST